LAEFGGKGVSSTILPERDASPTTGVDVALDHLKFAVEYDNDWLPPTANSTLLLVVRVRLALEVLALATNVKGHSSSPFGMF
jgi:hypothetical protein